MAVLKKDNLYEAKKHVALTVVALPALSALMNLGLRPGTRLCVENRYRLGGPVLLRVEDMYSVAIGKDVAEHIEVEVADG